MQAADVSPEPLTPELWCVQEGMSRDKAPVPHPVPVFRVRTTASFGFLQGKKKEKGAGIPQIRIRYGLSGFLLGP